MPKPKATPRLLPPPLPPLLPLLRATHLGPSLAVTAMATGLAAGSGVRGLRLLLVVGAVLAGQFCVGWTNDYVDRDRDRAAGRADKPIAAEEVSAGQVRTAIVLALVLCAVLSLVLGAMVAVLHLLAVGLGLAYDLGVKGTWASPLPYAGAFGLLPVVVAAIAGGRAPTWMLGGAALLGAGAHFLNTLPDAEQDARTGVQGLPQRLGPATSAVLGAVLLGAGGAVATVGRGVGDLAAWEKLVLLAGLALVLAALAVGVRRATRLAFTLSMGAAGSVVVLLLGAGPVLG